MSLTQRLETLRRRHAECDILLSEEEQRPCPNIYKLGQYKRKKLWLKDQMFALAHADHEQHQQERRRAS